MSNISNIAILQANPDKKELEPVYPNDGVKYQNFFAGVFPQADFHVFRVFENQFPSDVEKYDLYFITGSAYSVYDNLAWIKRLQEFIRQISSHKKYIVGLCFGHQIVAQALGGEVERSKQGWRLGIKTVKFESEPWMQPQTSTLNLIYIHQDQVVQPPHHAKVLCASEDCPYESYSIGSHILCCQGHPEFSNEFASALLPIVKHKFSEEPYLSAMRSLNQNNDGLIFAQWVKQFTSVGE